MATDATFCGGYFNWNGGVVPADILTLKLALSFKMGVRRVKKNLTLRTVESPIYIGWGCRCRSKARIKVRLLQIHRSRNRRAKFA